MTSSRKMFFMLIYFAVSFLVFSQEDDAMKNFFEEWIDNSVDAIGKNTSTLQGQYNRVNSRDPNYNHVLTRTIMDEGNILGGWIPIPFGNFKIKIIQNLYITDNSMVGKSEIGVSTNNVEIDLNIMFLVEEIMDSRARQIESPEIKEHWYGPPSVHGRFIWNWSNKRVLVIMSPRESHWIWEGGYLYITITQQ